MINFLLKLLDKIPYRTRFGLSLSDLLTHAYYEKIGRHKNPQKCLCGGDVHTYYLGWYDGDVGYEVTCLKCGFVFAED